MIVRIGKREYLTVGEVAVAFGVTITTVRNWTKAGKLPAVRHPVNRYRLYRKEDVERLLRRFDKGKAHGR